MPRILLLSTTTGYQIRSFGEAAEALGIDVVFATDRCRGLDDPWRDGAIPVRFGEDAEAEAVRAIAEVAQVRPLDGVLALGDRPTVLAARAAEALGLPGHPADAARAASSKLRARERCAAAGLRVPWFRSVPADITSAALAALEIPLPCVVKPLVLSGSRGVIRADDRAALDAACARVRRLLRRSELRGLRDPNHERLLIESYIPGREVSVEGTLEHGALRVLAIFDKPDPLDGPFFEETIYVTPSRLSPARRADVVAAVVAASRALGLRHGPIHAECRLNDDGVWVLEVAARPIGGLCARALRFTDGTDDTLSLEGLLLRHATGTPLAAYHRERSASGVMMIPIPRRGRLRGVEGVEAARAVSGVDEVRITAKPDQLIEPLPEGASYLGFIFARADTPTRVVAAIRAAHACLTLQIERSLVADGAT